MALSTPPIRNAFTLIEVMIAAGIFAIGLVAIAAIFPTAIQLQKQTFEEIRGDEFSKTVKTMVLQRGFDERLLAEQAESTTTITDIFDPITRFVLPTGQISEPPTVFSAPQAVRGDNMPSLLSSLGKAAGWSMTDRSGGSLETTYYTFGRGSATVAGAPDEPEVPTVFSAGPTGPLQELAYEYGGRNYFWTPLFIDYDARVSDTAGKGATVNVTTAPDARDNRAWGVFLFVLRGDPQSNYLRLTSNTDPTILAPPPNGINQSGSTTSDVEGFALLADIDLPQDKALTSVPDNVSQTLPNSALPNQDVLPYMKVPGVVRLDVTVDNGNHFEFINGVFGNMDNNNPIVRVGDVVLAENGITYTVTGLLPPAGTNTASNGVEVAGSIVDRLNNSVNEIWAAHPGNSGESSLVKIVQLVHEPDVDNLIR